MQRFEFILNLVQMVVDYFDRRAERKKKQKEERDKKKGCPDDESGGPTPKMFESLVWELEQQKELLYFMTFSTFCWGIPTIFFLNFAS